MSRTYLISDPHLGHVNIRAFRPQFATAEEHHEHIFEGMAKLSKRDRLIISGDICMNEVWAARLGTLRCNLELYLGNHDNSSRFLSQYLRPGKYIIHGFQSKKNCWLSHCPIHPMEFRNRTYNIHGHTHYVHMLDEEGIPDPRYINVCCEYTNFQPITWEYAVSKEYYYQRVQLHASDLFQSYINRS